MLPNVFDYQTNTLLLETNKVIFDIKMRGNKNIVGENSGTGKTLLWNSIKNRKELEERKATDISVANITLFNRNSDLDKMINTIQNVKENLIIIDHADLLLREKQNIISQIICDMSNKYLIFSRNINFKISPNYYGYFKRDDKRITLEYKWNMEGWY